MEIQSPHVGSIPTKERSMGEEREQEMLNIAAFCPSTRALGPGNRAVIWVQGCPFHCAGCISPEWIPQKMVFQYTPHQMAEVILSLPDIGGITVSGGEPMLQAEALSRLIRLIRQQRDLDVICFTGYRYRQLREQPGNAAIQDFLGTIDVLIDGPYIQKLHTDRGLRGSSNQKIIHLTGRLRRFNLEDAPRNVEFLISDRQILMVGIPTSRLAVHDLLDQMTAHGGRKESVCEWT